MPDDRSINRAFIQWGVLLSVLCLGIAAGALLAGRGPSTRKDEATRPVSVPRAVESVAAARAVEPDGDRLGRGSDDPAAVYSPLPSGEGRSMDRNPELGDETVEHAEPAFHVDTGSVAD